MRVTNTMVSNRLMLNVHRNMRTLDSYQSQIYSGKKIDVPSDDPILAARALKFRTNVSETTQYQRNVGQGLSWMSATDKALDNTISIMDKSRVLLVNGSTSTNMYEDRVAIATNIEELTKQIGKEMNATYAGRYVFSGFRTDNPLVYEKDNNMKYAINQTFAGSDVEMAKTLQKLTDGVYGNTNPSMPTDASILKLPYADATGIGSLTLNFDKAPTAPLTQAITVTTKSLAGPATDAYSPKANEVYYIKETGELVLGSNVYSEIQTNNIKVAYEKTGFKEGELNPMVNFDCTNLSTGMKYTMSTLNPVGNQVLEYEFGVHTRIDINVLGKDVLTSSLYSDLRNFNQFVHSVSISSEDQLKNKFKALNPNISDTELKDMVDKQITQEKQEVEASLHQRYNNMIGLIDKHFKQASSVQTNLGTRMDRLTLIEERLDEDYVNYSDLLSQNEDADIVEAQIQMNMARAAYEASLKAGSNVLQMTLADYIK